MSWLRRATSRRGVFCEGRQLPGPVGGDFIGPVAQLMQWLGTKLVHVSTMVVGVEAGAHDLCTAKDTQVARQEGRGHVESRGQLTRALSAFRQRFHHTS